MINQNKKNISLIGFMGSGKTTVGKLLANELSYSFIDMDDEIEKACNMSVSKIFEAYGEQFFRQKETSLIHNLALRNSQIISTGGGIIKIKKNVDILKTNSIVIFLRATYEHIIDNLKYDDTRPLLNAADKELQIKKLLLEREADYEQCCDYSIDVSGKTPEKILNGILLFTNKIKSLSPDNNDKDQNLKIKT